ncbi:MAG: ATP synthase F1 subunit epsilon [Bdellovibrionaceae bacterium]|nr:ATP synthase F1 subunit epsilon [Pseudobdellovibrionaceae bacterium]
MFSLTLVTPAKKILEKAALKKVLVPAYRGEIEILPGHAPLITTLSAGVLAYQLEGSSEEAKVSISWGYCEVTPLGEVSVLAETAEAKNEIDLARAEKARETALKQMGTTTYEAFEKTKRKLERAEARIKTVRG